MTAPYLTYFLPPLLSPPRCIAPCQSCEPLAQRPSTQLSAPAVALPRICKSGLTGPCVRCCVCALQAAEAGPRASEQFAAVAAAFVAAVAAQAEAQDLAAAFLAGLAERLEAARKNGDRWAGAA